MGMNSRDHHKESKSINKVGNESRLEMSQWLISKWLQLQVNCQMPKNEIEGSWYYVYFIHSFCSFPFFPPSLVRQFRELRIHALNAFNDNIAVFRDALIQFSVGGQFFDHYAPPVRHTQPLNISSTQPVWVVIPLHGRMGRFVRISLTFQSDWIILSEVAFSSSKSAKLSLFSYSTHIL